MNAEVMMNHFNFIPLLVSFKEKWNVFEQLVAG